MNVLEEAYIKLTNTNADLVNQVQAERHFNKQLNLTINLKDNEIYSLKMNYENNNNNDKVQSAINLIEKSTTSIVDENQLNQEWDAEDDISSSVSGDLKKVNHQENSSHVSSSSKEANEDERNREIERISNSYNELINTLNDKDLLINQLNNELNELKVRLSLIYCFLH